MAGSFLFGLKAVGGGVKERNSGGLPAARLTLTGEGGEWHLTLPLSRPVIPRYVRYQWECLNDRSDGIRRAVPPAKAQGYPAFAYTPSPLG